MSVPPIGAFEEPEEALEPTRQEQIAQLIVGLADEGYERFLDTAVARALFSRIPVLVEGAGDRAVTGVFWDALSRQGLVPARCAIGLEFVNCEGATNQPTLAQLNACRDSDGPERARRCVQRSDQRAGTSRWRCHHAAGVGHGSRLDAGADGTARPAHRRRRPG